MSRGGAFGPGPAASWWRQCREIFLKEWRCELRSRTALSTVGLFAFTTLVVVSLSLGPVGQAPILRPVVPVLLWVILLFSAAAGMPRTFLREEETRSADQLRLSTCASSLFCGKALYNLTLLLAVQALVAPLFVGLLRLPVADPGLFAAALLAGGVGLAVASTLIAAIVAQARSSGPLFSVLAFPILLPLLKLSIDATTAATLGEPIGVSLQLALLYDGMVTTAALMLFPVVWNP